MVRTAGDILGCDVPAGSIWWNTIFLAQLRLKIAVGIYRLKNFGGDDWHPWINEHLGGFSHPGRPKRKRVTIGIHE